MTKQTFHPEKNEWLEDDVSDLLFDDADEKEQMLGPRYRAVLLEYLGGQKPVTQEQCDTFLAGVASGKTVDVAALLAGAAYTTFLRLTKSNEVFAHAYAEAKELRDTLIIEKSIDQAINGVPGKNGVVFPANPQLQMHVRAADPDRFRERSEVINRAGEAVRSIRSPGDRERLIALLEKHGKKPEAESDDVSDLL